MKGEKEGKNEREREKERGGEEWEGETYIYIGCFEGAWAFSQRVRSARRGGRS